MKNRKSEKQGQSLYRKMGKVFALFAVLAGAALIQESMNPVLKQGNVLERQAYGDVRFTLTGEPCHCGDGGRATARAASALA